MLQMGKLKVHKSGKVKLHLGDVAFDMTRGIACEVSLSNSVKGFHRAVGSLPTPSPAHARGLSMCNRTIFPRQQGPLRKLTGTLCAPGAGRRYHRQCCWEGRGQCPAPGGGQQAHSLHARHEVAAANKVGFAELLKSVRHPVSKLRWRQATNFECQLVGQSWYTCLPAAAPTAVLLNICSGVCMV